MTAYVIVGQDYGTQETNCFGVFSDREKADTALGHLKDDGTGVGLQIIEMTVNEEVI